jgi:hypothetical protein
VVDILDDPHPIGALRRFLDSVKGNATEAHRRRSRSARRN